MDNLFPTIPKIIRHPKVLDIVKWPDPILKEKSKLVLDSIPNQPDLQNLLDDMVVTLFEYNAVGLAAIQVGIPLRILVVRDSKNNVVKVINPVLKNKTNETCYEQEGCLSFPGLFLKITRPKEVSVTYFDEHGQIKETGADGLLARAIQHELDHLDGKTFLDRVNSIEKTRALRKIKIINRKIKRFHEKNNSF